MGWPSHAYVIYALHQLVRFLTILTRGKFVNLFSDMEKKAAYMRKKKSQT